MDKKLRILIWDASKKVFDDDILKVFLEDNANADGTYNVYRAAAFALTVILANPERVTQYSRGEVSRTKQDITASIKLYRAKAGDNRMQAVSLQKVGSRHGTGQR
jgi:hypothetical protein